LFDLLITILDVLTALAWMADFIAWIGSKSSRAARKQAKASGQSPPPRSHAHTAFVVLTLSALILTALLVLKWLNKI
jgi:hypothetical protein